MIHEVIVATPGLPRPDGSAFAILSEATVYIHFEDPFQNCPQQENHQSAVGILVERNRNYIIRLGGPNKEQSTGLLPCGHQVSVVCNSYGGTFNIEDIDVRQWRTDQDEKL